MKNNKSIYKCLFYKQNNHFLILLKTVIAFKFTLRINKKVSILEVPRTFFHSLFKVDESEACMKCLL